MKIDLLSKHPENMETVIQWLTNEFLEYPNSPFFKEIIIHDIDNQSLPITFLAYDETNNCSLGTAAIYRGDLLSRQDLFPWFSALYVEEESRGKNIGKALQEFIIEFCKKRGYEYIYLYTDLENYYEKYGWEFYEFGYEFDGNKVKIYRYPLRDM